MNIIISPAKNMQAEGDIIHVSSSPVFLNKTKELWKTLAGYTKEELKKLYKANDTITELNYRRIREMDLDKGITPAVLAYAGLQYQSMAPGVFTDKQWDYIGKHLFILSGFYGILRAMDGVVPYRLEMQARLPANGEKDLYGYWKDSLYKELTKDSRIIVNLASKEYSKAIEPYLTEDDTFLTCVFGSLTDGKVKVKATEAKMARGSMVRWMAEHNIEQVEELKKFDQGGYCYTPEYSTEREIVFLHK